MTDGASEISRLRLTNLQEEIGKVARRLDELAVALGDSGRRPANDAVGVSHECVAKLIEARRSRARYLPADLFFDPVWDILLELFRAELASETAAYPSICAAAAISPSTAARYIKLLEKLRLIVRREEQEQSDRITVGLTPEAIGALRRYFIEVVQRR